MYKHYLVMLGKGLIAWYLVTSYLFGQLGLWTAYQVYWAGATLDYIPPSNQFPVDGYMGKHHNPIPKR